VRARLGLVVIAAALLAVWWWRHSTRAPARTATAGSAEHAGAARVAAQPANAAGRRIAGVVTLDGKPIDATVRLVGLAGQQRTTTDASGHFAFDRVPPAEYTVIAERPDTAGAWRTIDAAGTEDIVLVLHACDATIEGIVHDASGPIAHATVAESTDQVTAGPAVDSADDGRYRLCVTPGDSGLIVRADGYAEAAMQLVVSGHTHRDIELVPEALISGRVVRAQDHAPIAGATVQASPESWENNTRIRRAVSDAQGSFRITGESSGRFVLTATADHYTCAPTSVIAEVTAPAEGAVVEMHAAASVRGVVREAGAPVAGVEVSLEPKHWYASSAGALASTTHADGSFDVEGVVPGDYRVSLSRGTLTHDVSVAVARDDVDGVAVDVEPGATITGRVMFRGVPVDGASVQTKQSAATTDAAGRFTLDDVKPGTFHLYAESKRVGAFTPGPEVTVAAHEHKTGIEIELDRTASIAGTVVDQDGAPVGGVLVNLSLVHGQDWGTASTADDGTFTVVALAGGGNYVYEVRPNDGTLALYPLADRKRAVSIAVRDGSTHVTGVKIRVRVDRLAISGHVTNAAGDPLADVRVIAAPPNEIAILAAQGASSAVTDASGAFTLRNLQSGSFNVIARSPRGSQSMLVAAGRSDVQLVIPEPATIEAIVDGFHESPPVVLVSLEAGGMYRPSTTGTHQVFRDLPPGKYRAMAAGPDGDAHADVSVAAGAHASVTLRRVGRGSVIGTFVSIAGTAIPNVRCMDDQAPLNTVTTDAAGSFRIDGLPAGQGAVWCRGGDFATVTVPADGVATVKIVETAPDTRPKHPAGLTVEEQVGGSIVTAVAPGSPADKAGMRVDDLIVELEGMPVTTFGHYLPDLLGDVPPGDGMTLTYERGDDRLTAHLVVP